MHDLEKETARAYERLLVPALFAPWSKRLLRLSAVEASDSVLDVACGTGIFARTVVDELDANGSIAAVDPNPAMLETARRLEPEIEWRVGEAESLPYADETFDVVVSQFGLMFFPSPAAAMQEMMRVLKNGGTLALAVFDSLQNNSAYAAMVDVYSEIAGSSIADALRFPFSMGDLDKLDAVVREAGITYHDISTHREAARFADAEHMVLADVKGWFPFAQIELEDRTLAAIVDQAETVLAPFRSRDGAIEFAVSAHIVVAKKV